MIEPTSSPSKPDFSSKESQPIKFFKRIVFSFAIAETLIWAAYYYSFPALLPIWEADLGFSKTELTGAFTLSLIVSALFAPVAGRQIDKGNGRFVFAGGTVIAAVMLLLLSQVTSVWQFYLIWIVIGVAMAGSLYEACFSLLVHSMGDHAKRAITLVALVAGFAGTVSFPSAHILTDLMGWRSTVVVFAVVVVVVCIPLILFGCHYTDQLARVSAPKPSGQTRKAVVAVRTATFWLIGIAFFLLALDHGLIISHVLPILTDRGLSQPTAVFAASMIGPMQVVGRVIMILTEKLVSVRVVCIACFTALSFAGSAIFLASFIPILIFPFVLLQGAGAGVLSIIRPIVIAELLGRKDFGIISGLLAVGFMGGSAVAPIIASLVWRFGGYDIVLLSTIAIPIVALTSLMIAYWVRRIQ